MWMYEMLRTVCYNNLIQKNLEEIDNRKRRNKKEK